jgi:Holliday junction resolvase RusA-like endonuclease
MSKNQLRWTTEVLMSHPNRDSLLGVNRKIQQPSITKEPEISISKPAPIPVPVQPPAPPVIVHASGWGTHAFEVLGAPMGKPRMTQRDVWKKRPVVLRYREYCDRIRAAAGKVPENVYSVVVLAYLPMPPSWSKKKRAFMETQMMKSRPDWDNIAKAVCDALFEEDSSIVGGLAWKFWCEQGAERTVIRVLYHV